MFHYYNRDPKNIRDIVEYGGALSAPRRSVCDDCRDHLLKQKVIICPLFSRFCPARRADLSLLLWAFAGLRFGLLLLSASAKEAIQQPSVAPPTLLVAIDHRPTISLNGDWHTIADPYGTGLYTFHGKLRTDGYFMNGYQAPAVSPWITIFKSQRFCMCPVIGIPSVNRCSFTKARCGTKRIFRTTANQERGCFFMWARRTEKLKAPATY